MIEKEINESPDSALYHLEQISQKQLHSKSSRAKYALMKSMALDKNYIDVTDDSLINIAVNYYSVSKRHHKYKMLGYYYKGLVQKNAADYPAAIVSFEQAAGLAEEQKNWRYLGLIYRNTAEIFSLTNNNIAATEYHQKAIEAFSLNKDSLYVQYALYSLAVDLMNDGRFQESRHVFQGLIENADDILKIDSKLCYAQTYVELEDSIERALEFYRNTPLSHYQMHDYGYRAQAHMIAGQLDSAEYWIQSGFNIAHNKEEIAMLEFILADIDMASNRTDLAFKRIKKAACVQDSLTRVLLQQSLSTAQRNYYMHEVANQNMRMKRQKAHVTVWSIAILLIVCFIFMLFREKTIREEQLLKESIFQLELEKSLSYKSASSLVGTLFLEKYAHIGNLTASCFEKNGKKQITSLKKDLSGLYNNEKAFKDLYQMLNTYSDNIIIKLSEQLPSDSRKNLKTIALFFAGIPDELIQYIVKRQSVGSLKTYRSRLRTTIKLADCADEKLFLTHLERQPRKNHKTKKPIIYFRGCPI
jgi:tetratricopeptide (TPR) repeat protein